MPPINTSPSVIAVLGLGAMGARIAKRIHDSGHRTIGWNRSIDNHSPAIPVASNVKNAVESADVVIISATDSNAVEEIVLQLPSRNSNRTVFVLDMSTIGPDSAKNIAASLRPPYQYMDSPVLGTTTEAENGSLTILVGGTSHDVMKVQSILGDCLGQIFHTGEIGSGAAAKLIANFSLLAAVTSFGEAYAMGTALGLERSTIGNVLQLTPLSSQVDRRLAAISDGRFERRFPLDLALKDANLITQQSNLKGAELHITDSIQHWLNRASASGYGHLDYTSVLASILEAVADPD